MKTKLNPLLVVLVVAAVAISGVVVYKATTHQQVAQPGPYHPPPSDWPAFPPDDIEPPPRRDASFEEALASITAADLKSYVYKLADDEWEGRMSGKKGNVAAFAWLKDYHEKNGLQTEYQKFQISRRNPGPHNETGDDFTQNVYAWIEGTEKPNEIVVVGAHGDHIGYGPSMSRSRKIDIHHGADDNASGTAALQTIARAFAMMPPPKRTVVFQHYSAEEMGLIGSRYYCNNPTFPRSRPDIKAHVAMINMDMIGYLGRGQYFAGFYEGDSSPDLGQIIRELNGKYNFAERITSRRGGGSDHACFYNKRVPVASLHTGLHSYYHTPEDTADKINYEGMEQVARYAFELAYRVANDEGRPRFNHATFKELPLIHDHGHPGVPFYRHSYHKDLPEEAWDRDGHNHSHDDHDHNHDHRRDSGQPEKQ